MPTVLVLLYHRVIELPSDPHQLCVTPRHFAEHLELLRNYGRRLRTRDLAVALRAGRLPRRGIAVTFDDGYADNLHNARPLLERYEMPATMFVTTGYVGHDREFWWDELERLLLLPTHLPTTLWLTIEGRRYQWHLGDAAAYAIEAQQRDHGWHIGQKEDPSGRHHLYRSLYHLLGPVSDTMRRKILDDLRAWAGVPSAVRPTHRALDTVEVARLAEAGLIEVGAHTVTHPILAALGHEFQSEEICASKLRLEEITGHAVTSFAYPYGSAARSDYTSETVAIVREAGFDCACSYLARPVRRGLDPFQLPRAVVRDWDGDELERRLRRWFDA